MPNNKNIISGSEEDIEPLKVWDERIHKYVELNNNLEFAEYLASGGKIGRLERERIDRSAPLPDTNNLNHLLHVLASRKEN